MELDRDSEKNEELTYHDIWQDYRFIRIEQYSRYDNGHVWEPFPKWVLSDPTN